MTMCRWEPKALTKQAKYFPIISYSCWRQVLGGQLVKERRAGEPCSQRRKRAEGICLPVSIRDAVAVPFLAWTLTLKHCVRALCRQFSAGEQEAYSALGTNFPSKGKAAGCSVMAQKLDAIWVYPPSIAAPEYGLSHKKLLPVHSI